MRTIRALSTLLLMLLVTALPLCAIEMTIPLQDHSGRGWMPDLVHYQVVFPEKQFHRKTLRLVGPDGAVQPVQLSEIKEKNGALTSARVSFITALPANATVKYRLVDSGKLPAVLSPVTVKKAAEHTELTTPRLAVRVPPLGKHNVRDAAPAPVLAYRRGDGPWLGSSAFIGRKILAYECRLLASGPVYSEVEIRYLFKPTGTYTARVRVADRLPFIYLEEEYDLGTDNDGTAWEFALNQGDTTVFDTVTMAKSHGGAGEDRDFPVMSFADFARQKMNAPPPTAMPAGGNTTAPDCPNLYLVPFATWGQPRTGIAFFRKADRQANATNYPLLAWVPMHSGWWRRANTCDVYEQDGRLSVRMPLVVRPQSWLREVSSDTSPFSTQEFDTTIPATVGRRAWALALNPPDWTGIGKAVNGRGSIVEDLHGLRILYGVIGLDRYKDWILDWPDAHKVEYPRVFITREQLPAWKDHLDAVPFPNDAKKLFLFSGKTEDALRSAGIVEMQQPAFQAMIRGYGASQAWWAQHMDDAMACADLPQTERDAMRVAAAQIVYFQLDPDTMGRGSGVHPGNPNMPITRFMDTALWAAAIPDHPMAATWQRQITDYVTYKLAINTAPGGAWFEPGGYGTHSTGCLNWAIIALQHAHQPGTRIGWPWHRETAWYWMNKLSPYDPRYGARILVGDGNSGNMFEQLYGEAVPTFRETDPAFARQLRWAYDEDGQVAFPQHPLIFSPEVKPETPKLTSQLFPGYGVIFRAHADTRDETALYLRSGYSWSHWYQDQGNIILYGKGAPLVPAQSYQYRRVYEWGKPDASNPYGTGDLTYGKDFSVYSNIRVEHRSGNDGSGGGGSGGESTDFPYGHADSNILEHAFGPSVDYARSSTGYPAWALTQAQADTEWNRQIAFLKSPNPVGANYFIVRDSFRGPKTMPAWWHIQPLGEVNKLIFDGNILDAPTPYGAGLRVQMLDGDFAQRQTLNIHFGVSENSPYFLDYYRKKLLGIEKPATVEVRAIVQVPGSAQDGFTSLLYPRKDGEAAPVAVRLAPGVVKVVTAEGTDYICLGTAPVTFTGEGVSFNCCAGVVRVQGAAVTLALLSAPGEIGYHGAVLAGQEPCEKTIALKELTPGRIPAGKAYNLPAVVPAEGMRLYTLDHATPMVKTEGDVYMEGRHALVLVGKESIRFMAGPGEVRLSVGMVGVHGFGPFDVTFTCDKISGSIEGDTRTIVVTRPAGITRPMYRMDGVQYLCGFDDDSSPRNLSTPQWNLTLGVTSGKHAIEAKEYEYPAPPAAPPTRLISAP